MTIDDFLGDQDASSFPRATGPWISYDSFDPPYLMRDLGLMRREGIIEDDRAGKRFRLTAKAGKWWPVPRPAS